MARLTACCTASERQTCCHVDEKAACCGSVDKGCRCAAGVGGRVPSGQAEDDVDGSHARQEGVPRSLVLGDGAENASHRARHPR